ncbi:MAG: nucleotide exchange factor GrpE [Dehalococcoidia bacterium]
MSDNPRKREPPAEAEPAKDAAPPDAEPAQAEPAQADNKSLEEQVTQAKEDAQKYLASWQRSEADFQNYKRRVEQERDENRRFASTALIMNVLPILDDLERALVSLDARLAGLTWFEGIALIHRKILILLENAGVSIIQAEGQQFDPREHEAVMHAEGEEGKVLAEVQRGYKLHDRVLRPAMVVVGKAKEEDKPAEEEGSGKKEEEGEKEEES